MWVLLALEALVLALVLFASVEVFRIRRHVLPTDSRKRVERRLAASKKLNEEVPPNGVPWQYSAKHKWPDEGGEVR